MTLEYLAVVARILTEFELASQKYLFFLLQMFFFFFFSSIGVVIGRTIIDTEQ